MSKDQELDKLACQVGSMLDQAQACFRDMGPMAEAAVAKLKEAIAATSIADAPESGINDAVEVIRSLRLVAWINYADERSVRMRIIADEMESLLVPRLTAGHRAVLLKLAVLIEEAGDEES